MSWEEEMVMRDVTNTGVVVSNRIGREVAAQLDLEVALETSRLASHPYSTHSREWTPWIEVKDAWELPFVIERYEAADGERTAVCGMFLEICRAWLELALIDISNHCNGSTGRPYLYYSGKIL